ncbi:hypothetical protein EJ066_22715 [Mesorhizobium sp. M9A.F.Ca.ET.002.03.1.2]|uniref:hypothetical protein n=1 Tax=Mesorhizobium sp. M9A.F.Ca.ET.002.03.1.2 TaxID=2493668 RepID=UPI000F762600|nr:hypothetical protein [Mesorhizobium sp. M9A.F.Ca.ET.002.03.1.2]AZN99709.1 hypothetical protein EJ066_22715 [Mesorhizobium sp. M9A.F.Ca.ET.002.03.1.2]
MTDSRSSSSLHRVAATLAGACLLAGNAFADDNSTQKSALPGVTSDYRIARPTPQPEPDDTLPAGGNSQFKIGDTDVRISGSITLDVSAGAIKAPQR